MRTTIFSSAPYKFLTALALVAMVLAALPAMPAYAATITVTNTTDDLTSGNGCSLREAMINANNNGQPHPDCASGSGLEVDVITLASGSIHTLILNGASAPQTGDLDITDVAGLTIQASGSTAAIIDGGDIDRVLDVASGAGNLTLTSITIQNGNTTAQTTTTGGGISFSSNASLTLTNSAVTSNVSPNISGCGAGIFNNTAGTINITNSTIADNSCSAAGADGGGLFKGIGGALNITNSTFSGNSANDAGGAMHVAAGTVNITNSTFANNTAGRGGAIQVGGATVTIEFSTFSDNSANGGGLNTGAAVQVSSGSVAINRSILANPTLGTSCDQSLTGTGVLTNSLVESNGDCSGTPTSTADPSLGALGPNGGPTQTMAITTSSPAYNAADTCGSVTTDQRGLFRPQGLVCDLGAFEVDTPPTVVSVLAASANPTSASTVDYTVTFSEPVTGVGPSDFALNLSGVTGATPTMVTPAVGPASVYTVTVNTGSGSGTLQLRFSGSVSIKDADNNDLANLPFNSGDVYTVTKPVADNWYISGVGSTVFGQSGDIPVPADYTGDGKADLAVYRPGAISTWYISGLGSFSFGTTGDIPVPADYTGDGKVDIAVFRPGAISTWYISGLGSFSFGTTGDIPVPADYFGDSKADIAVYRPGAISTWYIYGLGSHSFGTTGDIPVAADYFGDSKVDLAVYRPGAISTWYVSGLGSHSFGTTGDIPVAANYFGDSKVDLAVYRPGAISTWYVSGLGSLSFGTTGDIPVPVDYTGDGRADIAVFRP